MMNRQQSGFTLVELLISTALLSLVLFVASYSFSLFAGNWGKELGRYEQTAKFTRNVELVRRVFASTAPLLVDSGEGNKKSALYLDGKQQYLRAASRYGVSTSDSVIYQLSIESTQEGKEQLVYQEVASNTVLLDSYEQDLTFTFRLTLLEDVSALDFNYYGWKNSQDKSLQQSGMGVASKLWQHSFNAKEKRLFPEAIKLSIVYNTAQAVEQKLLFMTSLPSDAERILAEESM
ncbi:type II secretion system protein J [uncultured Shewanella sp.]|uniref:PulJ/GspJ family protein n=1 Tax=uncultured Shewanella sp. TaxID=173975 RepID=UPI00261470DD|nr:prepilin-type N-terminal cleavage/methylation domain-containing protein [uncultured Shewanella sp.]